MHPHRKLCGKTQRIQDEFEEDARLFTDSPARLNLASPGPKSVPRNRQVHNLWASAARTP
jgi:hypothetical protein